MPAKKKKKTTKKKTTRAKPTRSLIRIDGHGKTFQIIFV